MRLLREAWPEVLGGRYETLDRLADLLGLDHDLAVFHDALAAEPPRRVEPEVLSVAAALARRHRDTLEREAAPLGARLFAEKPGRFARRLAAYWDVWRG